MTASKSGVIRLAYAVAATTNLMSLCQVAQAAKITINSTTNQTMGSTQTDKVATDSAADILSSDYKGTNKIDDKQLNEPMMMLETNLAEVESSSQSQEFAWQSWSRKSTPTTKSTTSSTTPSYSSSSRQPSARLSTTSSRQQSQQPATAYVSTSQQQIATIKNYKSMNSSSNNEHKIITYMPLASRPSTATSPSSLSFQDQLISPKTSTSQSTPDLSKYTSTRSSSGKLSTQPAYDRWSSFSSRPSNNEQPYRSSTSYASSTYKPSRRITRQVKQPKPDAEDLLTPIQLRDPETVPCIPKRGTCSPQCPSARWDQEKQSLFFSWIEDIEGCYDLFHATGTVVFLYTFADYHNTSDDPDKLKKRTALMVESTRPIDYDLAMSKPIEQVFEWWDTKFLSNETYYVGAMYFADDANISVINYSSPQMSENPLFVPAYQINSLQPGDEIQEPVEQLDE